MHTQQATDETPKSIKVPDWVHQTPDEECYSLSMYGWDQNVQDIDISREEYLELKRHLVEMRGYIVSDSQPQGDVGLCEEEWGMVRDAHRNLGLILKGKDC